MEMLIWYTTRAAGITAYLFLFATVALGLMLSGRAGAWWKGLPVAALHRFATWLMAAFLALHVLVLLGSTYLPFGPLDLLIPFRAAYEPLWTGIGVLATYLLALIIVSTLARKRLRNIIWYGVHILSYPAFVGATAHGIMTGSDTRRPWMLLIYLCCAVISGVLLALRSATHAAARLSLARRWTPGAMTALGFALMVGVLLRARVA